MKIALLASLLFLRTAETSPAQAPQAPRFVKSSLGLNVRPLAAKKDTDNDYVTSWGSYDKTFTRSRSIEIELRNFGREEFTGQYAVWWLGRGGPGGGERVVYQTPTPAPVQLKPGQLLKIPAATPEIRATDLNLKLAGVRRVGGFKLEGWMVVLSDGELRPIAVKASAAAIEDEYRQGWGEKWDVFKKR